MAGDEIAWLTTVSPDGMPEPQPVWFIRNSEGIVIYNMNNMYSMGTAAQKRLRHIEKNPRVTLHFNSKGGGDFLVISGRAEPLADAPPPSSVPGLLDKYGPTLEQKGQTPQWYDDNCGVALRFIPNRYWSHR